MTLLAWYDDTKNKPTADKLTEAIQRYQEKYGTAPTLILCNAKDAVPYQGVTVRVVSHVRPNNFHLGEEVA